MKYIKTFENINKIGKKPNKIWLIDNMEELNIILCKLGAHDFLEVMLNEPDYFIKRGIDNIQLSEYYSNGMRYIMWDVPNYEISNSDNIEKVEITDEDIEKYKDYLIKKEAEKYNL